MPLLLAAATTVHPTIPDVITFALAAAVVLIGAIGVVTSANPVHAALSLVMTLFGVAVLFVELQADFLAAVQVIVYAGAIVVLFLFVIMFLGVDKRENIEAEPLTGQRPLAYLTMALALGSGVALAWTTHGATGAHAVAGSTTAGGHSNTYLLGQSVFTTYLFAFEATAGLLVIAVVGAVVLARRPTGPVGDLDGEEATDPFPAEPVDEAAPDDEAAPAGGTPPAEVPEEAEELEPVGEVAP